jgi:hypothetical protein
MGSDPAARDGVCPQARSFVGDERASAPGDQITMTNSPLLLLVLAVLGIPPLVAVVGVLVRREQSFQYMFAAAASLVAVFTITGTVQFGPPWTTLGILAILAAIASHLWQFRTDQVDLLVVSGIYAMPVGLASVLLLRRVLAF